MSELPNLNADPVTANIRLGLGSHIKQDDAAFAGMELYKQEFGFDPKSSWLQALQEWDLGLAAIDRESDAKGLPTFDTLSGRMACLHQMMDFDQVHRIALDHFDTFTQAERVETAHWAAIASWSQGDFDNMARFVSHQRKGPTKLLYK